jgi:hypothetical protein
MRTAFYFLVAATCVVVMGFVANQMYRQHLADQAAAQILPAARTALDASRCVELAREAKGFYGDAERLRLIEAGLRECGISLSQIR